MSQTHEFDDELLSAFLDGELTADEQLQVERALAESAEVRQLFDDLKALRSGLQSLPRHELAGDMVERVMRRAERETMLGTPAASPATSPEVPVIGVRTGRSPFSGSSPWQQVALFFAGAAALLVMGLLAWPTRESGVPVAVETQGEGHPELAAQPANQRATQGANEAATQLIDDAAKNATAKIAPSLEKLDAGPQATNSVAESAAARIAANEVPQEQAVPEGAADALVPGAPRAGPAGAIAGRGLPAEKQEATVAGPASAPAASRAALGSVPPPALRNSHPAQDDLVISLDADAATDGASFREERSSVEGRAGPAMLSGGEAPGKSAVLADKVVAVPAYPGGTVAAVLDAGSPLEIVQVAAAAEATPETLLEALREAGITYQNDLAAEPAQAAAAGRRVPKAVGGGEAAVPFAIRGKQLKGAPRSASPERLSAPLAPAIAADSAEAAPAAEAGKIQGAPEASAAQIEYVYIEATPARIEALLGAISQRTQEFPQVVVASRGNLPEAAQSARAFAAQSAAPAAAARLDVRGVTAKSVEAKSLAEPSPAAVASAQVAGIAAEPLSKAAVGTADNMAMRLNFPEAELAAYVKYRTAVIEQNRQQQSAGFTGAAAAEQPPAPAADAALPPVADAARPGNQKDEADGNEADRKEVEVIDLVRVLLVIERRAAAQPAAQAKPQPKRLPQSQP